MIKFNHLKTLFYIFRVAEPQRKCHQKVEPTPNHYKYSETLQPKTVTNYEHFLSDKSKRRKPSALRELSKCVTLDNTILCSTEAEWGYSVPLEKFYRALCTLNYYW